MAAALTAFAANSKLPTYEKVKRVLTGPQNVKLALDEKSEETVRQDEIRSMGLLRRCFSNYSEKTQITKYSLKHV
jgi:hypothetical protein